MTGRLERLLMKDGNYERSNILRRAAVSSLAAFDAVMLRIPGVHRLASEVVMYGNMRLPGKA